MILSFCVIFKLVTLSHERTFKLGNIEELAGECGNKAGCDPHIRTISESHPEAHALPLHTTVESTVASANCEISLEEESGSDCVGCARNESCS